MRSRLDSRALGLFEAVADTLSFRQAAERLHISLPALSRAIRQLEARLGVELFERSTTRVALTPAGRRLLPHARQVRKILDEAAAAVAEMGPAPPLRLGVTTAAPLPWLDDAVAAFTRATHRDVDRRFATSPQLVRHLRFGRIDAAVIALPTQAQGLQVDTIESIAMCVALPAGHALAAHRRLSLQRLAGERLFWFERARQPAFFDHCERVFRDHRFTPEMVREPQEQHVLLAEVAAGRALALLPASFRSLRHRGLVYRALAEGEALAVGIGLATPATAGSLRSALLRVLPAT